MKPHEEHPAPWWMSSDDFGNGMIADRDGCQVNNRNAISAYNSLAAYAEELEGRNALTAQKTNAEDVDMICNQAIGCPIAKCRHKTAHEPDETCAYDFCDERGIVTHCVSIVPHNKTETPKPAAKPKPAISQCPDCGAIKRKGLRLCQRCLDARLTCERADTLHAKNVQLAKEVNRALVQRDKAYCLVIVAIVIVVASLVLR